MNHNPNEDKPFMPVLTKKSSPEETGPDLSNKLESFAFYVLLATVVLAPLVFVTSTYISIALAKTFVIALGTLIAAISYGYLALKERKITLPPKSLLYTGALVVVSFAISAFVSVQVDKSFFGQGFELITASFMAILFLGSLVTFAAVLRDTGRSIVLYVAMVISFFIIFLYQISRLAFGASFLSFGTLNTITSTILGNWSEVGVYAILVALILLSAALFLPLSRRMKIIYWVLIALSGIVAFVIGNAVAWAMAALVLLGLTVYLSAMNSGTLVKRIAWLPLILCVIAVLYAWKGPRDLGTVTTALHLDKLAYTEVPLPWQMTLDVTSGAIKNYPIFGVGPNNFSRAFIAYKPAGINNTDAYALEFTTGNGYLPTLIASGGLVGTILWIVFFVFYSLLGARALRKLGSEVHQKFGIISSFAGSAFLWLVALFYVPSHALMFFAFIMTGIFAALAVSTGAGKSILLAPSQNPRAYKAIPAVIVVLIVIGIVWGAIYVKKTVALAYFASGVKELTAAGDASAAATSFGVAVKLDNSDIYWQALEEAGLAKTNKLVSTLSASTPASTTQSVLTEAANTLNEAAGYAQNAVVYDPGNYYNFVSKARVSELAATLHMDKGYDSAVDAYVKAIGLNPQNPSLYLTLARFQASQNKLDDAEKTLGAALQVKSNYLDAIFLLAQVEAAKGNTANAITAATVATQINPQNPLLFFELGLLDYNVAKYSDAATALETAVKLQPDYANAAYFLGLSYVRLGRNSDAIAVFQALAKSNPDSQEVQFILTNLEAGKSPFADAQPPVTPTPEKRPTLPIKEKPVTTVK